MTVTSTLPNWPSDVLTHFASGTAPPNYPALGGAWYGATEYADCTFGNPIRMYFHCVSGFLKLDVTGRIGDNRTYGYSARFFCGTFNGHTNSCSPLNLIYSVVTDCTMTATNSLGLTVTP